MQFQSQDSIQSSKLHTDISTESIEYLRTGRTKPMPIIFHLASEDIIDIEKCRSNNMVTELNSIYSVDSWRKYRILYSHFIDSYFNILATLSVQGFRRISMKNHLN